MLYGFIVDIPISKQEIRKQMYSVTFFHRKNNGTNLFRRHMEVQDSVTDFSSLVHSAQVTDT